MQLQIQRVEFMPNKKDEGTLYISERYKLAIHLCACGCGYEVVTPTRNGEWSITESETGVSLSPSIGNFNFPCKSHYWVRNSMIKWT